jgi:sialate O-acetylesterase
MEMPVIGWTGMPIFKSEQTIKEASNYPNIRLFNLQKKISETPMDNCVGKWEASSPEAVKQFSAMAYFFGLELYRKLNIPVGLIMTAWGGTPSEAWTCADDIKKYAPFTDKITKLRNTDLRKLDSIRYEKDVTEWQTKVGPENEKYPGSVEKWMSSNLNDNDWKTVSIPEQWQADTSLNKFRGIVWFRKVIEIPSAWEGKDLKIDLGPIDEMDVTYLNNEKVGESRLMENWGVARTYTVPGNKVAFGKNVIVIRMINTNGVGGINGTKSQLKIYPVNGDTASAVSLAGEWKYRVDVDIAAMPDYPSNGDVFNAGYPSSLFNGMINPLIPFAIKGAIWYQGESNVSDPALYGQIFPEMVKCWRTKWNQGDFPFYFVQIAPFNYGKDSKSQLLREAQLNSLKSIPNSGMAVTMDIATIDNIHPPEKESVGNRLAYWALSKNYGKKDIPFSGPLYKEMKIEGSKIRISFDHAKKGLMAKGGDLTFFAIAGSDGKFVPAKAVIEKNTVVVSSSEIVSPVAVRYGWSNIATPNLFNTEGLPASSFRTDNWDK